MKFAVVTFGCRMNQADSLRLEDALLSRGGLEVSPADADLLVVNTCSVTASADQGARQTIRRIARDNPAVTVVVTGCYATRRPDEVAALPNVVRVVKNDSKDAFEDYLDEMPEITTAERYDAGDGACGSALHPGVAGRTALTLRVQTGCDEACSYCIIPSTRGRGRSRPLAAVRGDYSSGRRGGLQGNRDHGRASRLLRPRPRRSRHAGHARHDACGLAGGCPLSIELARADGLYPGNRAPRW